ncbi:hypothetical protein EKK58_06305 [Candidatus Dependentiae bacterium]|nr:MAG: hypothetical protein EKK58_06305 [Candidatus Dependentiae bacterium]
MITKKQLALFIAMTSITFFMPMMVISMKTTQTTDANNSSKKKTRVSDAPALFNSSQPENQSNTNIGNNRTQHNPFIDYPIIKRRKTL